MKNISFIIGVLIICGACYKQAVTKPNMAFTQYLDSVDANSGMLQWRSVVIHWHNLNDSQVRYYNAVPKSQQLCGVENEFIRSVVGVDTCRNVPQNVSNR